MRQIRRIACGCVAVVMAVGMMSCGKSVEKEPPTASEIASVFAGSFSAETDVTILLNETEELSLSAIITRSDDCCEVEVTAPEYLEGLTFSIDSLQSGKMAVRYKGLEIQPEAMPGTSLGSQLASALTALSTPEELTVTESEQGWCISGETQIGSFSMLLDSESHSPLSLILPDAQIGCRFLSFEAMTVFRPDRIEEDFAPQESSEEKTEEPSDDLSEDSSEAVTPSGESL